MEALAPSSQSVHHPRNLAWIWLLQLIVPSHSVLSHHFQSNRWKSQQQVPCRGDASLYWNIGQVPCRGGVGSPGCWKHSLSIGLYAIHLRKGSRSLHNIEMCYPSGMVANVVCPCIHAETNAQTIRNSHHGFTHNRFGRWVSYYC